MKNSLTKKAAYIGAGVGLALFVIFGLLPGSLIGGAAGLNIAGWLFGMPLEPGLISRLVVIMSMLIGVLVSGIAVVTATSTLGWIVGRALDSAVKQQACDERRASGVDAC